MSTATFAWLAGAVFCLPSCGNCVGDVACSNGFDVVLSSSSPPARGIVQACLDGVCSAETYSADGGMLTGDARVQVLAFVERDRLRVRLVVDAALPRDGQVLRICSKDSASKTLACWRSDPIAWSSAELEPCTTQRCLRADPVMHRE